jgi:CheY-like chemotaxis protein
MEETYNTIIIQFSVIDSGIGIPADKHEYIFQSFSQASSETTRKYGGTGLGLAISKQLVELQGGKISLTSKEKMGSTFSFYLPFQKALRKTIIQKEKSNKLEKLIMAYNSQIPAYSINVLLVEDNKMNQMLASTYLLKNNFRVDLAEDGNIALEKLHSNNYDIILMDLHMPIMDGYETTKVIRKDFDGKKKNIPIIALTAAATKGEIEKCLMSGMNDYIVKPYKPADLLEKVLEFTIKTED